MADATALAATMFEVRTSRPLERSWRVSPFDGREWDRDRVDAIVWDDGSFDVSMFRCFVVSLFRCFVVLLFRCFVVVSLFPFYLRPLFRLGGGKAGGSGFCLGLVVVGV
jgi:hypothetical protein